MDQTQIDEFVGSFSAKAPSRGTVFIAGHRFECVKAEMKDEALVVKTSTGDDIVIDTRHVLALIMAKEGSIAPGIVIDLDDVDGDA